MKVAGLQMDLAWENPGENFQRAREMAMKAMDAEARLDDAVGRVPGEEIQDSDPPDLLVLPEMFATGFSMEASRVSAHAEETRDFLRALARETGAHVLAGYAEEGERRPANACSIFDPGGQELLHFRKLHPFSLAREDEHYEAGDALPSARVAGVSVTTLICYDLRFPEPFRAAAPGTDLFCVLANWPSRRSHAWSTLLRARAMENQAFVLGVNRVGMGGGEPHSGDSALLDPLGMEAGSYVPLSSSPTSSPLEGLILGEVDPGEVKRIRSRFGFLDDARPELYRRLGEHRQESRS